MLGTQGRKQSWKKWLRSKETAINLIETTPPSNDGMGNSGWWHGVASTAPPTRNRRSEEKLWWVRLNKILVRNPCYIHQCKKFCLCVVGTKGNVWHVFCDDCYSCLTWWHDWSYIVSSASWMDGLGGWCGSDVWRVMLIHDYLGLAIRTFAVPHDVECPMLMFHPVSGDGNCAWVIFW